MAKPGRFLYQVSQRAYYICKMDEGFFGKCSMGYKQPDQPLRTYFTRQSITPCSSAKPRIPKVQRPPRSNCNQCTDEWMCQSPDFDAVCKGCQICEKRPPAQTGQAYHQAHGANLS